MVWILITWSRLLNHFFGNTSCDEPRSTCFHSRKSCFHFQSGGLTVTIFDLTVIPLDKTVDMLTRWLIFTNHRRFRINHVLLRIKSFLMAFRSFAPLGGATDTEFFTETPFISSLWNKVLWHSMTSVLVKMKIMKVLNHRQKL